MSDAAERAVLLTVTVTQLLERGHMAGAPGSSIRMGHVPEFFYSVEIHSDPAP